MPEEIKDHEKFQECLNNNPKVVVDFTATWCGPCKAIAPTFSDLAGKYPNIKFIKVDVDENSKTAEECGISAMPTFHCYKDGKKNSELCGANKEKLEELVKDLAAL